MEPTVPSLCLFLLHVAALSRSEFDSSAGVILICSFVSFAEVVDFALHVFDLSGEVLEASRELWG